MTGFDSNASDPSYSWFNIDICTPPVEEDYYDETVPVENNVKQSTEHVHFEANSPNSSDRTDHKTKNSATTKNEPAGSSEPSMQNNNGMKFPLPPFEYVTERPPVRPSRPKTSDTNKTHLPSENEHSPPVSSHFETRCDGLFSSLRNITVLDVASSKVEDLIALSIRHEQASPGAGLDLFVKTMLRWTDTTTLSAEALPAWFTALYEKADLDSQRILRSYLSNPAASRVVSTKFIIAPKGLFLLAGLLPFLFTLLAAPIFTLFTKVRESRRVHSWDYTDCDEQY